MRAVHTEPRYTSSNPTRSSRSFAARFATRDSLRGAKPAALIFLCHRSRFLHFLRSINCIFNFVSFPLLHCDLSCILILHFSPRRASLPLNVFVELIFFNLLFFINLLIFQFINFSILRFLNFSTFQFFFFTTTNSCSVCSVGNKAPVTRGSRYIFQSFERTLCANSPATSRSSL